MRTYPPHLVHFTEKLTALAKEWKKGFHHRFSFDVGSTSKSTFQWGVYLSHPTPLLLCETCFRVVLPVALFTPLSFCNACPNFLRLCVLSFRPKDQFPIRFVCCFYNDKPLRFFPPIGTRLEKRSKFVRIAFSFYSNCRPIDGVAGN